MERIAFLIESTGVRLGCLLNPETLIVRRTAGIEQCRTQGRPVTGAKLRDDPILFTGGGSTELTLDLLFDVNLAGSSITTQDVRELTRPLWDLAENTPQDDGYARPPLVRFVWGKSWNIPGVVAAIAERLEFFTPEGSPRRSWLRMRMLRVDEAPSQPQTAGGFPTGISGRSSALDLTPDTPIPPERVRFREVNTGGGSQERTQEEGQSAARLDEIAYQEYGDANQWRTIASFNDVDDPMHMPEGQLLGVPDWSFLERLL